MKIIIMGCGRVGARLAGLLDAEGHSVTVLDTDSYSFRRLPTGFKGKALVGNGIDEETLKRAGIQQVDAFIAVTQGTIEISWQRRSPSISLGLSELSAASMILFARNCTRVWESNLSVLPAFLRTY